MSLNKQKLLKELRQFTAYPNEEEMNYIIQLVELDIIREQEHLANARKEKDKKTK